MSTRLRNEISTSNIGEQPPCRRQRGRLNLVGATGSWKVREGKTVSRVVMIATESLLEATLGSNRERVITVYGIPGYSYEIRYNADPLVSSPWRLNRRLAMPPARFQSLPLTGPGSDLPRLFLRANKEFSRPTDQP